MSAPVLLPKSASLKYIDFPVIPYGLYSNGTYLWVCGNTNKIIYKYNIILETYITITLIYCSPREISYDGVNLWVWNNIYFVKLNLNDNTFTEYKPNHSIGRIISNTTNIWIGSGNNNVNVYMYIINNLPSSITTSPTSILTYDLSVTATGVVATGTGVANCLIYVGIYVWAGTNGGYIHVLNNTTNTLLASIRSRAGNLSPGGNIQAMMFDGTTNVWISCDNGSTRYYSFDGVNLSESMYYYSGYTECHMTIDNNKTIYAYWDSVLGIIDTTNKTLTTYGSSGSTNFDLYYTTYDGSNWGSTSNIAKIYKYSYPSISELNIINYYYNSSANTYYNFASKLFVYSWVRVDSGQGGNIIRIFDVLNNTYSYFTLPTTAISSQYYIDGIVTGDDNLLWINILNGVGGNKYYVITYNIATNTVTTITRTDCAREVILLCIDINCVWICGINNDTDKTYTYISNYTYTGTLIRNSTISTTISVTQGSSTPEYNISVISNGNYLFFNNNNTTIYRYDISTHTTTSTISSITIPSSVIYIGVDLNYIWYCIGSILYYRSISSWSDADKTTITNQIIIQNSSNFSNIISNGTYVFITTGTIVYMFTISTKTLILLDILTSISTNFFYSSRQTAIANNCLWLNSSTQILYQLSFPGYKPPTIITTLNTDTALAYYYRFLTTDVKDGKLGSYVNNSLTYNATLTKGPTNVLPTIVPNNFSINGGLYSSLYLNYSGIRIDSPFTPSLNGLSIGCWIYELDASPFWTAVCQFGNGTTNNKLYYGWYGDESKFRVNNGSQYEAPTGNVSNIFKNTWCYTTWTLSYSSSSTSQWNMYVNGKLVYKLLNTNYPTITSTLISIGISNNYNNTDNYSKCYMNEFRIYNRVLTPNEVYSLYNYSPLSVEPSPVRNVTLNIDPALLYYYRVAPQDVSNNLIGSYINSKLNYNATLFNGASISSNTFTLYGVSYGSLYLKDSSLNYMNINTSLTLGNTGLTFAFWYKSTNSGSGACIFDFGNSTTTNNELFVSVNPNGNSNNLYFKVYSSDSTSSSFIDLSGNKINNSIWNHVVWTLTSANDKSLTSTWNIYVNGILFNTYINNLYPPNPSNDPRTNNYIGKSNSNSDAYYNGYVNEFRIYNRVLTSAEAIALYTYNPPTSINPDAPPLPPAQKPMAVSETITSTIVNTVSFSPIQNCINSNNTYVYTWTSQGNTLNVLNIITNVSCDITIPTGISITSINNICNMDNDLFWIDYTSTSSTRVVSTFNNINKSVVLNIVTGCTAMCIDNNNLWITTPTNLYKYNYSTRALISSYSIVTNGVTSLFSNVNYGGNLLFINYGTNIRRFNITTGTLVGDTTNPVGTIICVGLYQIWYGTTASWSILNWSDNSALNIPGTVICTNGSYIWTLSGYNLFMYNIVTTELTTTSLVSSTVTTPVLCDNATVSGGFAFLPLANNLTGSPVSLYKISFPTYVPPFNLPNI